MRRRGHGVALAGALALVLAASAVVAVTWQRAPAIAVLVGPAAVAIVAAGVLVLRRRRWRVDASTPGPPALERCWHVVGWTSSAHVIDDIARALQEGRLDVRPEGAEPVASSVGESRVAAVEDDTQR